MSFVDASAAKKEQIRQHQSCCHWSPFAYIFQMIIHSTQPPSPPPQGRFIEKTTLYGNIVNTPSAGLFRDSV